MGTKANAQYTITEIYEDISVVLSNDAHVFRANKDNVAIAGSTSIQVYGYQGSTQVPTTVGTISGLPSAGMTASISNNTKTNTTITISVTTALTSSVANSGVLTIPITVAGKTINKTFSWSKAQTGATGAAGTSPYSAFLTNEAQVFAYGTATDVTTQLRAFQGTTEKTVQIISVNGKTAATAATATGKTGMNFKVSSTSAATAPTITFSSTTSLAQTQTEQIPIVYKITGDSANRTIYFSYSSTTRGATGATGGTGPQGPQGPSGTAASLVDVTASSQMFKSTQGANGVFSPDYIYLYPRFQTVTYSKWQYSTNGGTSWTNVTSGSNGLTIATYNSVANSLRIANSCNLYTNTITSISFRCVSSDANIWDSVTVTKIYDANSDIIVGTQTAATNAWTGVASFTKLTDGQQIVYWLPYAGTSTSATLNLTLADGTTTGAKNLYYSGTNRITTHYAAGNVVHLTYRENVSIAGSSTKYTGWWADANYAGSDTYDRIKYNSAITAVTAISSGRVIAGTVSGFKHIAASTAFDINKPILYAGSAISASATGSNNYIAYSNLNLSSTKSGFTGTKGKTVYIVGTLNGTTFTPNSTVFTTTEPASNDGLVYIALGVMSSTTNSTLFPEHPLYKFVNGKFQTLSQVAFEAQGNLDNLEIGGRNYILNSEKWDDTMLSSASSGINSSIEDGVLKTIVSSADTDWDSFRRDNIIEDNFKTGDQFTFAIEIKSDDCNIPTPPRIYFKTNMGYYSMNGEVSSEYSWCYYTGQWKDENNISFHLNWSDRVGTYYIRKIMFIKGNKLLDWTPAPEDVDSAIQDANTSIGNYAVSLQGGIDAANKYIETVEKQLDSKASSEEFNGIMQEVDAQGVVIKNLDSYRLKQITDAEKWQLQLDRQKGNNLIKNSVMKRNVKNAANEYSASFWLNQDLEENGVLPGVTPYDDTNTRSYTDSNSGIRFSYDVSSGATSTYCFSSEIPYVVNKEHLFLSYKIKGKMTKGTFFIGMLYYAHGPRADAGFSISNNQLTDAYYCSVNEYNNTSENFANFTVGILDKNIIRTQVENSTIQETLEIHKVNGTNVAYLTYYPTSTVIELLGTGYSSDELVNAATRSGKTLTLSSLFDGASIVTVKYQYSNQSYIDTGSGSESSVIAELNKYDYRESKICYKSNNANRLWLYNPMTGGYVLSTATLPSADTAIDSVRVIIGVRPENGAVQGDITISDLKLEYDTVSPYWTSNGDETYSKQYRMDEEGFSISSATNTMFIDEDEIAAYKNNSAGTAIEGEPVFQIKEENTILHQTTIKNKLIVQDNDPNSTTEERENRAFTMQQLNLGTAESPAWYFLFF